MPTTTAEMLPLGRAIDLLRDEHLIYWDNGHSEIASVVEVDGITYTAEKLDASLQHVLRLPVNCDGSRTIDSQVDELITIFADCGFGNNDAFLLASNCVATWRGDCLPGGCPILNLWGPPGTEAVVLDIIAAVVRRPLPLHAPQLQQLWTLPDGLSPTLILKDPSQRWLRFLVEASSRGASMLRDKRFVNLRCFGVVYTRNPVGVAAIHIPLLPAAQRSRVFMPREADELAARFQPGLLHSRLSRHTEIEPSQVAFPEGFSPSTRSLAQKLVAALEGAPEAQMKLMPALMAEDEQHKIGESQQPVALLVEALLVADHERKSEVYVGEMAELMKGISTGRGDPIAVSDKAVGSILRNELGLPTMRRASGYRMLLDNAASKRIHELANYLGVLSLLQPHPECPLCTGSTPSDSERSPCAPCT